MATSTATITMSMREVDRLKTIQAVVQHWLVLKNSPSDPEIDERPKANLRLAFDENKRVLEAIQRNEDKPRQWRRIPLGIDGSSIKMRRIVEEMAASNNA